ncbi:MAG TPA: hypothetical protein VMF89_14860 [Polyangiales bacterium]|nr:hypothetical protein [Polyangiales bacterium]
MTDATGKQSVLTRFKDGVSLASEPVRVLGMRLTSTMTVLELAKSQLLLYSPVPLTEALRTEVEALGSVAHLYAPNTFHHAWIGEWARAFPQAQLHAPSALREKRPDLRIDRAHDREPCSAFDGAIDEVPIAGFLLAESVLVHRESKTLLVADLVHNIGRPDHGWTAFYSKAMGFYDRVAISRAIRWTAFKDKSAASESLARLVACEFDRLVVGHGAPLEHGARAAVLEAYAWLSARMLPRLPGAQQPKRGYCG